MRSLCGHEQTARGQLCAAPSPRRANRGSACGGEREGGEERGCLKAGVSGVCVSAETALSGDGSSVEVGLGRSAGFLVAS